MIIRGGFNVYPREVEEVLMTHPAVSLAAVIGVPHASHGEEVKAYVIRNARRDRHRGGAGRVGREQMAAYKYPRMVEFVDGAADDRHRQDPQTRVDLIFPAILELWLPFCPFHIGLRQPQVQDRGGVWPNGRCPACIHRRGRVSG